jgi:hypothetical protein
MNLLLRSILPACVLSVAVAAALPARAQSPAERRAHEAQAALSERYTQLWTQMPAAERPAFARAQRHWLHVTRWEEQRRCAQAQAATAPAADAAALASDCLAEVTQRHLRSLPPAALAVR